MRTLSSLMFAVPFATGSLHVQAQSMGDREQAFLKAKPLIGDALPDVTIYSPDGSPFHTGDLRGHYTVLTFGCLT